ncbi:hypothetical protein MKW94_014525 [Papaver nudicaule]|uniref:DUF3615 domain-containing protein n=1 Tax=Papaver nudicaule TaxID=74823 RepID=A0AA42B2H6_PAPNU|nr:hypothetical protein [Papaver nudicaule]
MVVTPPQKLNGGSSTSKCSTDVSDPLPDGSRVMPSRPKAKPRKESKYTSKDPHGDVRPYATDAMRIYNERAGTKYELVEPGYITHVVLSTCFLHHINFTAKKTDVACAPVEMFFSELTTINKVRCVKFVNCMGPKDSISGNKNNGCCYCMNSNVQHPRCRRFMGGAVECSEQLHNSSAS